MCCLCSTCAPLGSTRAPHAPRLRSICALLHLRFACACARSTCPSPLPHVCPTGAPSTCAFAVLYLCSNCAPTVLPGASPVLLLLTHAPPVLHLCFTSALWLHQHSTCAPPVLHLRFTFFPPRLQLCFAYCPPLFHLCSYCVHWCFPCALPALHLCFIHVLHLCFTCASLFALHYLCFTYYASMATIAPGARRRHTAATLCGYSGGRRL